MSRTLVINLFVAAIAACILVGCERGAKPPPGLIVNLGDYTSPSSRYTLQVTNPKRTLVDYVIVDNESGREFAPEYDFSNVHRWAFFWEGDNRLWCHSADIGLSVWTRQSDGSFLQEWFRRGEPFIAELPAPIYDHLSESMQSLLDASPREGQGADQPPTDG